MAETTSGHFQAIGQQREAIGLGMWTFLVTEVLFFGGLFTGYAVYRHLYAETFAEAGGHLYMWIGAANTGVLLLSSLTMALAVHGAERGRRRRTLATLWTTVALGVVFLGVKALEYWLDHRDGIVPGPGFHGEPFAHPDRAELFFVFYYFMTALHALHVTIGVGVNAAFAIGAARARTVGTFRDKIETAGLYWHFVDIVWIFLFPLLYLIG